ncbi:MAG: sel1 repeat family protein [Tannerella sp.]|nr:sel1 repeat family protein [Tannerella sp.]
MEKGTIYSLVIRAIENLTFQKVKAVSEQFMHDLPQEVREILLNELKCGPKLMETEPSMAAFLYTYGNIYEARLQRAFTHLSPAFFRHEIEWFDYDDGQAVGLMVYHDFLKSRNLHQQIRRITLVHPSESCLKRGALHAHLFFPKTELRLVCKSVNLLRPEDLLTDSQGAKLHLLMNIRNVDSVSAVGLSKLIQANVQGYNQFVCLSPFYGDLSETTARLDAFVDWLTGGAGTFFSENLKAGQLLEGKPWTCALRVFATGGVEEDGFEDLSGQEEIPAQEPLHEIQEVEEEPAAVTCEITSPSEDIPDNCEITKPTEAPETVTLPEDGSESCEIPAPEEPDVVVTESEALGVFEPEEPDSIRQLRVLAEQGNARAQNNLGFMYEIGQDVSQDDAEAVKWYHKAAEQGHAKAQYNLANHYALGRGIAQNYNAAAQWYLRAAEQGIPSAMNHLGTMYAVGRGVEKNEAESMRWYTKAAERGDEYALRILQKKFVLTGSGNRRLE